MRNFLSIIRRFVPPYKNYVILNFIFNVLAALLNVFSFALIIPILQILFKTESKTYSFIDWGNSTMSFMDIIKNNAYWWIANLIETNGAIYTLFILSISLIIMTFLKTAAAFLSSYFIVPVRTGVVKDIRNQINDKILELHIGFFSEERKGDILSRISGDVNEVETSVMSSLNMIMKNPIMIVIFLITMFVISWQLTLFVSIMLPIMGYVMGIVGKKLKRKSYEAQNKWGELMSQVDETLGGLRIIKAFNAENKISRRFKNDSDVFRRMTNKINQRQYLAHPMSEFLGTITIAIVLLFGGWLIISGKGLIDAPTFIYYLVIFYSIINPAKEVSRSAYAIQRGLASMERIDKILNAKSEIVEPQNPQKTHFNRSISYNNVWFKYENEWVIKGVNLKIEKGKTIALVGESGSGKSTMVDLLPRFFDIQQGEILIDEVNIKNLRLSALRSIMGNVNQEAILFNDTFFNNIAFGVENATQKEVEDAAKIANAHEFIVASEKGYATNIGDRGGKLSGGQRQRISIARAVLRNPQILILDEATSALDTTSERLVQEALERLMKNRTTIIVAHRLSTIKNADEICVMHDGKIVEQGRHETLYARNGIYTKLCTMQTDLSRS